MLNGLASPVRIRILRLLRERGKLNVNEIVTSWGCRNRRSRPTCRCWSAPADRDRDDQRQGPAEDLPRARFDEIVVRLDGRRRSGSRYLVEVACRSGLHRVPRCSAPCGLCSRDGVIGLLDVPDCSRPGADAGGAGCGSGAAFVEYKFPNNAKLLAAEVRGVEFSMECPRRCRGPTWTGRPTSACG